MASAASANVLGPGVSQVTMPVYSVRNGAEKALTGLIASCKQQLPPGYLQHLDRVSFTSMMSSTSVNDLPVFPCPMKEQEATSAIRALEGIAVASILDLQRGPAARKITIDTSGMACYLMSAYMTTLDSLGKVDSDIKDRLPGQFIPSHQLMHSMSCNATLSVLPLTNMDRQDTDLNQAQSVTYRRLSANLYQTKMTGEYYHIHGSLDATKTLQMLGLEPFRPDLVDYEACLRTIGDAVAKLTTLELESLNRKHHQAGAPALRAAEFSKTRHGQAIQSLPPFTVEKLEADTPPTPFPTIDKGKTKWPLEGIRVLEVCRVIAGPVIGRSLAAHGASVLKVTSPCLPDVPFFQLDVNNGKHTTSLHLRSAKHREVFEDLLYSADMVIDGYRPGALDRLGYGPEQLARKARERGKGIVYIAEDCFGGTGLPRSAGAEWSDRAGWQQIADCVTGVAWEQGRFMQLNEPVVPPFPMSDYGTGALGCVAALTGLYLRATKGGSWIGRTSLCQYNIFLLSLEPYQDEVLEWLRSTHDDAFFDLRHNDSVDEVSKRALKSVKRAYPSLFGREMLQQAWSHSYGGTVAWPREALHVEGVRTGFSRTTRPNGYDTPTWHRWEVENDVVQQR